MKLNNLKYTFFVFALIGCCFSLETDDNYFGNSDDTNENDLDIDDDKKFLGFGDVPEKVCYGNLGCFESEKDFVNFKRRPRAKAPQSPEDINTQFLLYTKTSNEIKKLVYKDSKDLASSGYKSTNPTKVIVHGFLEKAQTSKWMAELKDAFLENEDVNVVLIDWGDGNGMPYSQAASNTRVVGAVIARMIMWLEETVSANRADFHCIGHSLGAHVCGYAGERLTGEKGRLGRITGLDPAEPYFEHMGRKVRLDYTDATFVDIIHTDGEPILRGGTRMTGGFGLKAPAGHVDFYPNGGENQPGCSKSLWSNIGTDFFSSLSRTASCDHSRAYWLMVATAKNPHLYFRSYECQDFDTFKQGKCLSCADNKCASMGLRANEWKPNGRTNVLMYLDTTDKYPFHLSHYQVKIKISTKDSDKQYGDLVIQLEDASGTETEEVKIQSKIYITPGETYVGLVSSSKIMRNLKSVKLHWINQSWYSYWTKIHVTFEEVRVFVGASQKELVFPAHDRSLESKTTVSLNAE